MLCHLNRQPERQTVRLSSTRFHLQFLDTTNREDRESGRGTERQRERGRSEKRGRRGRRGRQGGGEAGGRQAGKQAAGREAGRQGGEGGREGCIRMLRFLLGVLEDALRHGPVYLIPACLSCRECGVSFSTNINIINEHQDINLFSGYAGSDPVNWKIGVCRHTI